MTTRLRPSALAQYKATPIDVNSSPLQRQGRSSARAFSSNSADKVFKTSQVVAMAAGNLATHNGVQKAAVVQPREWITGRMFLQPDLQVFNLAESGGQGSRSLAQIFARLAQLQIAKKAV